jgi:uncharacterized protein YxeA
MTGKQYIVVIAAPLVIIMTIVTILSSGFLATSEDRVDNIKIEITYSGSWEAMLYNNEEIQSLTGFTKKTLIVYRPSGDEWTLSFEAEKKDDSTNQLKITIKLIDGTKLGEAQTVEPYGKVSISMVIV